MLTQNTRFSKLLFRDFPDGPVVGNLLLNAGDTGLIPLAVEQLGPHATTTDLTRHNGDLMCRNWNQHSQISK